MYIYFTTTEVVVVFVCGLLLNTGVCCLGCAQTRPLPIYFDLIEIMALMWCVKQIAKMEAVIQRDEGKRNQAMPQGEPCTK